MTTPDPSTVTVPRLCAIVPMRHDSRRIVGKNYRPFAGLPLFHHVLRALEASPSVDCVVVDTDSPAVREGCEKHFPSVRVIERPADLRDEHTSMNHVLLHTTEVQPAELYLQTHSTNPLLTSETIETAIATFRAGASRWDSLFGVTRLQQRLWSSTGTPINHDLSELKRTQDLEPIFIDNSCIYLFSRESLLRSHNRIGSAPKLFEIDRLEAIDIDEESDWLMAEALVASHSVEPIVAKPVKVAKPRAKRRAA